MAMMATLIVATQAVGADQKKIVTDFEDFGTWRMKESSGVKPGYWWPAYLNLSGSDLVKYHEDYVGELRFSFDPQGKGPFVIGFERFKMSGLSGFLNGIEFDADARQLPVSLRFVIQDSTNKAFRTAPIALTGNGWMHYRLEINAETLKGFADCKFPARLKRISLESATPCEGSIFLDDIALTGRFTKRDQIGLTPIYDGVYYPPGKNITLHYRLRNARQEALSGDVNVEVKDFAGKKLLSKNAATSLAANGVAEVAFEIGALPIGAYEVVVTAKAGEFKAELQDHFGVFIPNAGRPNRHPMWFGIGDQGTWQGDTENKRHLEWMKLLGVDVDRFGFFSNRFTPENAEVGFAGWRRLIKERADSNIDILFLWSDSPPWTQEKVDTRNVPDFYPAYDEFCKNLGTFLKEFSNVKYLEFWNEPDLDFYHGDLPGYVEMFKHFSKNFKSTHPSLLIVSGGVTTAHPREKAGFSRGMYQQAAGLYDIAAYHAHGPVLNNEQAQQRVEKWLREAGLEKRYCNTETGDRSLYDAEGRRRQAITLVKKIVFSKSIPGFEFYSWFTLQDYWDMDPEADDSFGLVTSDNRAKAAFVAYNNLIAKLANTKPDEVKLESADLSLYSFRKDDGRFVYVGWPIASKRGGLLWIKTNQSVEVSDMFGATQNVAPLGNVLPIGFGDQPLYLSGKNVGERIQLCSPQEQFLQVNTEVNIAGDQPALIPVAFRNPTNKSLEGTLTFQDDNGRAVAKQSFSLEAGKTTTWSASVEAGTGDNYDERTFQLSLKFADRALSGFSFPVQLIRSYPIRRVPQFGPDPTKWPSLEAVPAITLNRPDQVVELTYDPSIPAWKGPDDLSAVARMVHDERGIRFQVEVKDDTAGAIQRKDQLFRGDDVQVAIGRADEKEFAIVDLGLSAEGPAAWCSQHRNPALRGQWNIPLRITRTATGALYDAYLPYEQLGLVNAEKAQAVRLTFLINEDDGRGRVRWIQWKDGIGKNRTLESLGYGSLE